MRKAGTIIPKGVSEPRTAKVRENVVELHHVTLTKKGSMVCNWTFDFAGVTQDELLRLAARSLVIDQRPPVKKADNPTEWATRAWSVRELLDGKSRREANPVKKAAKALGLPEDVVARMLEEQGLL
jgi:hypothetical protein